jgi:capsular polysaccharide biosynthesis protein
MARALVSRPVIEDAISQLDLSTTPEALADHLEAEPLADTQFISISYEDSSPQRAQRVVNTIGDVSSKQLSALSPIATPVSAVVWERALVPTEPVGPSIWIIGSLALATGLIFGVLLAFMLEGLSKAGVLRKRHGKW